MNGIVYGVRGPNSKFLPALISIRSLRKYYNGPITVITDITGGFIKWLRKLDVNIIYDRVSHPRFYGVLNELSPYDNTLLISPNTMFFRNIDKIWDGLESREVLVDYTISCKEDLENMRVVDEVAYAKTSEYVDDSIRLFSLDTILFNKKSNEFFKTYEEEFLRMGHGALTRSIAKTGLQSSAIPVDFLRCEDDSFTQGCHAIDNNDVSFIVVKGREMFKYFVKYQKDIFDECMVYGNVGEIPDSVEHLLFQ
jgi:hypothetical protein